MRERERVGEHWASSDLGFGNGFDSTYGAPCLPYLQRARGVQEVGFITSLIVKGVLSILVFVALGVSLL